MIKFFKHLSLFLLLSALPVLSEQINVGQALNGFNSRILHLETKEGLQDILNDGFVSYMDKGYSQSLTDNLTNLFLRIDTRFGMTNLTLFGVETVIIEGNPVIQTNSICKFIDNRSFDALVSNFVSHAASTNAHFVTTELIGAVAVSNSFQYVLPTILETNKIAISSNAIYLVDNGVQNTVFETPETVDGKEARFRIHFVNGGGSVTWFPNITWVYGAEPIFDEIGKIYVICFESIDHGTTWRGLLEYTY